MHNHDYVDDPQIIPATWQAIQRIHWDKVQSGAPQLLILTDEMLQALIEGKMIACGIDGRAYGVFISKEQPK